jgi:hypothetical protein
MTKKIIMIHGRHFKPQQQVLCDNWLAALRYGIERDYHHQGAEKFDNAEVSLVYYGDLSNAFLRKVGKNYNEAQDIEDRSRALASLKNISAEHFDANQYQQLPGKSAFSEALADVFSTPLSLLGLGDKAVGMVAPDMTQYWDPESEWGSAVRWRLTETLNAAMADNQDILLISHSLGSIVSYDVLWKFSHYGEYQHLRQAKLSCFLTLGSPLGDENVKTKLKGASAKGKRRYPQNIKNWVNVAAEDDYIAHDGRVANDFKNMQRAGLISNISDHKIYNLAQRYGKSNPHHGTGYLISPTVSKIVMEWLNTPSRR